MCAVVEYGMVLYWHQSDLIITLLNGTKYINSRNAFKYNFEIPVLDLSISILCYIILPLNHIYLI